MAKEKKLEKLVRTRDKFGRFIPGNKESGRKTGSKNKKTIGREQALAVYQQQMIDMMKPIMLAQLQSAQGLCVMLRPRLLRNPKTRKMERKGELTQVKDPAEVIRLLEKDARGEISKGEDFHVIWTKDPNVKAIKDIWEMVFGKAPESIKVEHKGKVIILDT